MNKNKDLDGEIWTKINEYSYTYFSNKYRLKRELHKGRENIYPTVIYEYTDRLFENDSSKPIFIDPIFTFYNEKTRKEPAGMKTLNLQALVRKYLNKIL